jgi:hypothetical protein
MRFDGNGSNGEDNRDLNLTKQRGKVRSDSAPSERQKHCQQRLESVRMHVRAPYGRVASGDRGSPVELGGRRTSCSCLQRRSAGAEGCWGGMLQARCCCAVRKEGYREGRSAGPWADAGVADWSVATQWEQPVHRSTGRLGSDLRPAAGFVYILTACCL